MSKPSYWTGSAPHTCDICHVALRDTFVDGKTLSGPWANMCPACHTEYGIGLGLGAGQQYTRTDNKWLKTQG